MIITITESYFAKKKKENTFACLNTCMIVHIRTFVSNTQEMERALSQIGIK